MCWGVFGDDRVFRRPLLKRAAKTHPHNPPFEAQGKRVGHPPPNSELR